MRYADFNAKMVSAHRRILSGVGAEQFHSQVMQRFPLSLNDQAIFSVGEDMGWNTQWLAPARKASAKAPSANGNLTDMFKAKAVASQPPPQQEPEQCDSRPIGCQQAIISDNLPHCNFAHSFNFKVFLL